MEFEELSFEEAPKIVEFPGSKSKKMLQHQREIEGSALSYPISIPVVMDEGRGATIKDVDGNIFIDFLGGAAVLSVGHCNPSVLEAVKAQQNKITHTLDFTTEIRIKLIEKIREVLPGNLKNSKNPVWRTIRSRCSGNGVETCQILHWSSGIYFM